MEKKDEFKGLKAIAARRITLDHALGVNRSQLVDYARQILCIKTRTLFNDPIWDNYTEEEILVEFFSHQFYETTDPDSEWNAQAFLAQLTGVSDEDEEWFNAMERKYIKDKQKEIDAEGDIKETF